MVCIGKMTVNVNKAVSKMTVKIKVTGLRLCIIRLKIAAFLLRILQLKATIVED